MSDKKLSIDSTSALRTFVLTLLVTSAWAAPQEKVLHNFGNGVDGATPYATLISDATGNLYGTTLYGGASMNCPVGCGTVFELTPGAGGKWKEKLLYSFKGGGDGYYPQAGLIFDTSGNLYGTTFAGGASPFCSNGCGTVFQLAPGAHGTWAEKVVYSFNLYDTDGIGPVDSLIFDAKGALYGTTWAGGTTDCSNGEGCGTVFQLAPGPGGTWTESVLYSFCVSGVCTDGATPFASLIFDVAGNLYGTTSAGGNPVCSSGCGVVFRLTPNSGGTWTEKVLHSFGKGKDAANPYAGLVFDAHGNLYGTTYQGGAYNAGTVYKLTAGVGGTWTEKVLHSFGKGTDGDNSDASLIFDKAGNLYGTAAGGGTLGAGIAFKLSPGAGGKWSETVLHNFNQRGNAPEASLILDASGNLYGTTTGGGTYGGGTVFEITP
jgi:uncharacterized repeat protein (TIGR03803 family)